MKNILAIASLLSLLPAATLAGPVPTPTINFIARRQESEAPAPTDPPTSNEPDSTACPFSVTVTASRTCSLPACEDPMFCAAMINLQNFGCDCLKKPPTTTTVTPRCDSDCGCTIPTQWVVPKGCDVEAVLKGEKGPVKVNPNKDVDNLIEPKGETPQTTTMLRGLKGPVKVNPNKDIDNLLKRW
ncbi:hypothetical protein TWF730_000073 [Orbilia blumenaviensis]|uniref:Uncharacterized protein n=1 Tax=Orbilia blumenaviensis TaxID=1796055 RepID=A0AAV9VMI0_9PEZI